MKTRFVVLLLACTLPSPSWTADDTEQPPDSRTTVRVHASATSLGTCTSDDDCDDGVFCNGAESCDTDTGNCVAVSACPPFINGCLVGNGECDEETDTCLSVPDDSICDDGLFCSGRETCDAQTGDCAAVSACPPFINGCLVGNGECDEETDTCLSVPDDSICDDGLFCSGRETCDAQTGDCAAVSACPPFINGCLVGNGECDEETDTCLSVPDDSICDDGLFCSGRETCDAQTGDCAAVSACPPFIDGCLTSGACDEDIDECLLTPDDGLCNAQEVCAPDGECIPGTPSVLFAAHTADGAPSSTFYSIDPETGALSAVGSAPAAVFGSLEDMAALDGLLWIAGGGSEVWVVNMNSGQPIGESLQATLDGAPQVVEGLTAQNGRLVVGFRTPAGTAADRIGVLSPFTGEIDPTTVVVFDGDNADFDGLGTNTAGSLFSTDVEISPSKELVFDIYSVRTSPPAYDVRRRFDLDGDTACRDLTFVTHGAIFCADDRDPFALLKIDPLTFDVLEAFPYEIPVDGIAAVGPPGTLFTIRLNRFGAGAVLSWDEHTTARSYDIVTGDLGELRQSAGNYATATTDCRANDFGATDLVIGEEPAPGAGFWYVVRGQPRGSYGSAFPSQVGVRDDGIAESPNRCD